MQDSEFLFLTNENKTLSGVDELKCPAEIYVPNGVTKIDRRAFASCPAKKIFLPDTVTQIGYEAFYGCDALEYVRFPKRLDSVEPAIFRECFSLQKVELGDEISAFSESMFECCYSLEEASFRIGITELPRNLFSECASLESLVIPEGVAVIRSGAAAYCQNLSTLVLPSSIRIIEDDAFRNCVNLAHIRFSAENPVFFTDEESGALFERRADDTFSLIKVPVKATQIRIPKNVAHSHSEAFQGCDSIEKVYIDCDLVEHPLFVALKTEIVDAEFINETEEKRISPEPEIEKNETEETQDLGKSADSEAPAEKETTPKKQRKPREKKQKPIIIEEALSAEPNEKTPDLEKGADAEAPAEKETTPKKQRKPREKKQKPAIIEEALSAEPNEPQITIDAPALETAPAKANNKSKAERADSPKAAASDNAIADEIPSAEEYEIAFEPQIEEPVEEEKAMPPLEAEAEQADSLEAAASDDATADEIPSAEEYEIAFEPQIEEPLEAEEAMPPLEAEAEQEDSLAAAASDDAIADEIPSAEEYEIAFEPQIEEPVEAEEAMPPLEAEAEQADSLAAAASDDAIAAILEQNIATGENEEEDELAGITITIEELDEAMMRGIQEEEESDYKIPEGIFPDGDAEEAPEDLPPPEPRFVNGMMSVSGAFEIIDERTLYPDRAEEDLCALAPNEMEDITTLVGVTESLDNDGNISKSAKEFCVALAKKYDLKRVYLFGALALDNEEFLYGFQKFALYRNVVFVPDAADFDSLSSEVKTFAEIAEFGTTKFYNSKSKDLPEIDLPFKIFACENSQIEEKTEQEEAAAETIPEAMQENSAPQTQKNSPVTGKGLLARAQEKESASKKGLLAKAQTALDKESED